MLAVVANDWGAGLSWVIWVLVMLAVVALVVFGTRGRTPRKK
jgi:Sec-independent protein translocase protein TatA